MLGCLSIEKLKRKRETIKKRERERERERGRERDDLFQWRTLATHLSEE